MMVMHFSQLKIVVIIFYQHFIIYFILYLLVVLFLVNSLILCRVIN
jgi:hypothetical protein